MGVFRTVIVGTAKSAVNVPGWIGLRGIKENAKGLWSGIKVLLLPSKNIAGEETFAQAVERMNLTEEDLANRSRHLGHHAIIYLFFAILCFSYAIYLLIDIKILSSMLVVLITAFFVLKAYISFFWRFQIRQRKLGCTFKEWLLDLRTRGSK
jgi:intracellular multiplication protein IcmV